MESVDRLRELAADMNEDEIRGHSGIVSFQGMYAQQLRLDVSHEWLDGWHAEFGRLCDAIEAEVAEGYVELPAGADGEPIRVGDTVCGGDGHGWRVTHLRIGRNHSVMATDGTESKALRPEWLLHVKPPTVEGVLLDMHGDLYEATRKRWASECTIGEHNEEVLKIVKGYASKLRLADGGDAS